ncbi:hydrophobe/amphiphile efflux-1 (HAE1) family protein [Salinisphaera sp. PC39]|uniref:efflux RND transporter permease subunit n=1 Tax=Salinisphaera sp. PC39 TaxID=1304156 RepID=UPI00333F2817
MVNFFLARPVFAWVLAIVTMLAGVMAIMILPIQRYPTVAPPAVEVSADYPGASADTVSSTVVQVIEQQMTGVDNLLYMSSTADSSGHAQITLTFASGTDPDIAQVQVQNKLKLAEPRLPEMVRQQGISVEKASTSFLMVMAFVSTDGRLTKQDLADFVASNLAEPIGRVAGVGSVQVFGSEYAMRIWLKPDALVEYGLTVADVAAAIEAQNAQVTAGQLGGLPAVEGQQLNATVTAQTLLNSPGQFREILLKTQPDGSRVRLADVARIDLGTGAVQIDTFYNGEPAAGLGVNLAPGANALAVTERIKARLEELEPYFPEGVEVRYPYQTAPFVEASLEAVVHTIIEAIVLVVLVMLLFLQSWRATLIPAIAIPVVLLGAFAVMAAFGFSINMLTLFGLVLAIGLLVDDAIVVVENVERVMHEDGVGPMAATRKSMGQITSALVGIGVVLSAVFIPMAFFPGSTGAIYRQFSLSIAGAMVLSVLVALILSPILCARLLKPQHEDRRTLFQRLFGWFERGLGRLTRGYVAMVGHTARHAWSYSLLFLAIVGLAAVLFARLPGGFLPAEDQGFVVVQYQLPAGATQQRTIDTMEKIKSYFLGRDAVRGIFTIAGFSFSGRAQNAGLAFVNLKPWGERDPATQSAGAIIQQANQDLAGLVRDGQAFAFNLPPIPALGRALGFELQLQDRGDIGHDALMRAQGQLMQLAGQSGVLTNVRPNGLADNPRYKLDIDHAKAQALGVPLASINQLLTVTWGSRYLGDFLHNGRIKRVYLQGDAPYRMLPSDFDAWYLRNAGGGMTPLSELTDGHWTYGSPRLERFNGVPSRQIQGEPAPGYSSGEAMAEMERLMAELPPGVSAAWSGMSYQERQAGAQAPLLYALSVLVVFLALAALYESWTIPVSVMLAVPLGVLGAVLAAMVRGLPNDVFFQIGILTTVGVTARNAILLVEFARTLESQGHDLIEATREAARVRLRPILMTSVAFSMGVVPLAFASGAGATTRAAIGTAVLGGMLSATVLATFFIPLFYVVVRRITDSTGARPRRGRPAAAHDAGEH